MDSTNLLTNNVKDVKHTEDTKEFDKLTSNNDNDAEETFDFNELKKKSVPPQSNPNLMDTLTDRLLKYPKRLAMLTDLLDKNLSKEQRNKLIGMLGNKNPFNTSFDDLPDITPKDKLQKKLKKLSNIRQQQPSTAQHESMQNKLLDMLKDIQTDNKNQN